MRRTVIAIASIAVVLAGVYLYLAAARPPAGPAESGPLLTRFTQPHFVKYRKGGEREWSLRAEVVEESPDGSGAVRFEKITEGVLFHENKPRFSFVADRGVLTEDRDLHLSGNVRFFEDGEVVFESEEVIWLASLEIVRAPNAVTAMYDGQRLRADRLDANLREDTVTLSGNVVWTTGEGIEVTAARAVYANERLEFTGEAGPVRVRFERESSQ